MGEWSSPSLRNKAGDLIVGPIPYNYSPTKVQSNCLGLSRIYNVNPTMLFAPANVSFWKDSLAYINEQNTSAKTENCNCTLNVGRRCSYECIDRAVYIPYPGDHIFKFHLQRFGEYLIDLQDDIPLHVAELNGRDDFSLTTPGKELTTLFSFLQSFPRYRNVRFAAPNSTIRFKGTGLFHFSVQILDGYSYCDTAATVLLWLYTANLPYPMGQVCFSGMTLILAVWLFAGGQAAAKKTLLDYKSASERRTQDRAPITI
ncbi:hypothetical protein RvY_10306 [Ramazzottius varieornatus]|uniref:Cation channel sperm-associated protein subunit beta C-terminal domain-containing protein n=1 Tax=Ramazzottius varieornatus TaxID=947166 RepID=A0A1D1VEF9_RAMVA|nr:hypothetical protein RvY_10306 [Ramazzottius varieornatus]